jgi:hypothetical protein
MQLVPPEMWAAFERRLDKMGMPAPQRPDYRKWVRFYLDFCHKYSHPAAAPTSRDPSWPSSPPRTSPWPRGTRPQPPQTFKPADFLAWAKKQVALAKENLMLLHGRRESNRWWQPARWARLEPELAGWLVVNGVRPEKARRSSGSGLFQ